MSMSHGISIKRIRPLIADLRARDGNNCWLCGFRVPKNRATAMRPTIDHVLPIKIGGSNDFENLRLVHRACNWARGSKEPGDYLVHNPLNKERKDVMSIKREIKWIKITKPEALETMRAELMGVAPYTAYASKRDKNKQPICFLGDANDKGYVTATSAVWFANEVLERQGLEIIAESKS